MNTFSPTILKIFFLLSLLGVLSNCEYERGINAKNYHQLVNRAELAICQNDFESALDLYGVAFRQIERPFGADLYNAALASHAATLTDDRDLYLQLLINGSDNTDFVRSTFISNGMSPREWDFLQRHKQVEYNSDLRFEMCSIQEMHQLIGANGEIPNDTIGTQSKLGFDRLFEIALEHGLPSHIEIGYSENLKTQPHHAVLLEIAQKRSSDKSIVDLEPVLRKAVHEGRLDPELAILYLDHQNDKEKGRFASFATKQYRHELLPESMNNTFWVPNFSKSELGEINELRQAWFANSIEDIQIKATYMNTGSWPFLFTSVNKSVNHLVVVNTAEEAVDQYLSLTEGMRKAL